MVGSKPNAARMSDTKKNPARNGSMVIPSQNIDCCSHTPAIFGRPLPYRLAAQRVQNLVERQGRDHHAARW